MQHNKSLIKAGSTTPLRAGHSLKSRPQRRTHAQPGVHAHTPLRGVATAGRSRKKRSGPMHACKCVRAHADRKHARQPKKTILLCSRRRRKQDGPANQNHLLPGTTNTRLQKAQEGHSNNISTKQGTHSMTRAAHNSSNTSTQRTERTLLPTALKAATAAAAQASPPAFRACSGTDPTQRAHQRQSKSLQVNGSVRGVPRRLRAPMLRCTPGSTSLSSPHPLLAAGALQVLRSTTTPLLLKPSWEDKGAYETPGQDTPRTHGCAASAWPEEVNKHAHTTTTCGFPIRMSHQRPLLPGSAPPKRVPRQPGAAQGVYNVFAKTAAVVVQECGVVKSLCYNATGARRALLQCG